MSKESTRSSTMSAAKRRSNNGSPVVLPLHNRSSPLPQLSNKEREYDPNSGPCTIYQGRKYSWQAKANLHIHMIEHPKFDCIEVIAWNASSTEANHVYVSFSSAYRRIEQTAEENRDSTITQIQDIYKRNACRNSSNNNNDISSTPVVPLTTASAGQALNRYLVAMFLLDRISVSSRKPFAIDVQDYEKLHRLKGGSGPATGEEEEVDHEEFHSNTEVFTTSLQCAKPVNLKQSVIIRTTASDGCGDGNDEQETVTMTSASSSSIELEKKNCFGVVEGEVWNKEVAELNQAVIEVMSSKSRLTKDRAGCILVNNTNKFNNSSLTTESTVPVRETVETSTALGSPVIGLESLKHGHDHHHQQQVHQNKKNHHQPQHRTTTTTTTKTTTIIMAASPGGKPASSAPGTTSTSTHPPQVTHTPHPPHTPPHTAGLGPGHGLLKKQFSSSRPNKSGGFGMTGSGTPLSSPFHSHSRSHAPKTFGKFQHDNELYAQALSFIHISEYYLFQTVCKRWHSVLSDAMKSILQLDVSSRDCYLGTGDSPVPETKISDDEELNLDTKLSIVVDDGAKRTTTTMTSAVSTEITKSIMKTADGDGSINPSSSKNSKKRFAAVPPPMKWRSIYVNHNMVQKVLTQIPLRNLQHLSLNYVCLSEEDIKLFGEFKRGLLKSLSLGIIKVAQMIRISDCVRNEHTSLPTLDPTITESVSASQPGSVLDNIGGGGGGGIQGIQRRQSSLRTSNSTTARNNKEDEVIKSLGERRRRSSSSTLRSASHSSNLSESRKQLPSSAAVAASATASVSVSASGGSQRIAMSTSDISAISEESQEHNTHTTHIAESHRFLNGLDVAQILSLCGYSLVSLKLSVTIGTLPDGIFAFTPRLMHLIAADTPVNTEKGVESIRNPHQFEGHVDMQTLLHSIAGKATIPDLLCSMSDSSQEATLLLDKMGRIAVVSEGFTNLTGYSSESIHGSNLKLLRGKMTKKDEFAKLLDGITVQKHPVESTTFLRREDGRHFLGQVIFIPNIGKYRGMPLDQESLSHDFLAGLALEHEEKESVVKQKNEKRDATDVSNFKGVKSWLMAQKELSYHYVRVGYMSEPI